MIEIDGSRKSGSGTIVRDAVVFSILTRQDILLRNIRVKRPKPGLRHQHLKAIEASALISGSSVEGAALGSKEIVFKPGSGPRGGSFRWDIGTAGSTSMLALTILPIMLFAGTPSIHMITGGLFQDFAPSLFHLEHVLLPLLRKMGADVRVKILQPGYVPRGGGRFRLEVSPLKSTLSPRVLKQQGEVTGVKGIALSSHLAERRVSGRMADACREILSKRGWDTRIEIIDDKPDQPAFEKTSLQAGAALAVWATTESGCILGADMAGARGRTAETIGKKTAGNLLEDLDSGATVDRHLADQLIPFAALAAGTSTYLIPSMTDHVESRLWLVQKMLGAGVEVNGNRVTIEGTGMKRMVTVNSNS
ncbi:MAG: RNA 3'-phosphate cyclase [Deltaproteobacteria bacterium HGW-Deltaproteobacteria-21]|nr:MAG: RNA 3'-phosphate cyclase [Deltaproteobacteria bacterium HGW-Deltaproteobacteria-21]